MKRHACMLSAMCSGAALAGEVCVSPFVSIPDNNAAGIDIPIVVVAGANEQVDAVTLSIEIDHLWVGDLVISLVSPDGTTLTVLDRPGIPSNGFPGPFGCGGRDLDVLFSDDASQAAEDVCSYSAQPVIEGAVIPSQPLSAFNGEAAAGVWTLRVSDRSAYDTGVVVESCLTISTTIACSPDLTGDGVLDFFDVSAFLSAYTAQDPAADFTGDGAFNFFDVSAFLNAFSAGCP